MQQKIKTWLAKHSDNLLAKCKKKELSKLEKAAKAKKEEEKKKENTEENKEEEKIPDTKEEEEKKEDKPIELTESDLERVYKEHASQTGKLTEGIRSKAEILIKLNSPKCWNSKLNGSKGDESSNAIIAFLKQDGVKAKNVWEELESIHLKAVSRHVGLKIFGAVFNSSLQGQVIPSICDWLIGSFKNSNVNMVNYQDELESCGEELTLCLRNSFFECFNGMVKQLKIPDDNPNEFLLRRLIWKFTQDDIVHIAKSGVMDVLINGNGLEYSFKNCLKSKWGSVLINKKDTKDQYKTNTVINAFECIIIS